VAFKQLLHAPSLKGRQDHASDAYGDVFYGFDDVLLMVCLWY
jgi:hypothetical protein